MAKGIANEPPGRQAIDLYSEEKAISRASEAPTFTAVVASTFLELASSTAVRVTVTVSPADTAGAVNSTSP